MVMRRAALRPRLEVVLGRYEFSGLDGAVGQDDFVVRVEGTAAGLPLMGLPLRKSRSVFGHRRVARRCCQWTGPRPIL